MPTSLSSLVATRAVWTPPPSFIMPHQALAVCMALHKRLGMHSPLAHMPVEVLRHIILQHLVCLAISVHFTNFRRMLEPSFKRISEGRCGMVYPPNFHTIGRVLGVNTHSQSLHTVRMRRAWSVFLLDVVGGLFYDYTIIFNGALTRSPDWAVIVFESCPHRPVFDNNASHLQGLITGFFASWDPPERASAAMSTPEDFPIVVRAHGDRMQTFMFGKYVPRKLYLDSSTYSTPLQSRRLLQAQCGTLGGWHRICGPALRGSRTRNSIPFLDAARRGDSLECLLE